MAALPINVSTTRRERFMLGSGPETFLRNVSVHHLSPRKQAKAGRFHGIVQRIRLAAGEAKGVRKRAEAAALHPVRTGIGCA